VSAEQIALVWASTGSINSRAHLTVSEPYAITAICGVSIANGGTYEIRPSESKWCPRCVREARKLDVDPSDVGIENDLM
jgi:hypothetical protein